MAERAKMDAMRPLVLMMGLALLLAATAAQAAFTPDELDCRETISKFGTKLGQVSSKVFSKCHKKRSKGKLAAATDCNTESGADPSGKIAKIGGKLVSKSVDRCGVFVPSDLLYTGCPAPCDATVPSLDDFTDVGNCLQCVITNAAMELSSSEQGAPLTPMGSVENKCHDTVGKSYTKHLKTLLKERVRCQKGEEAASAMDTSACTNADPRGKILKATEKGSDKIGDKCASADLDDVDSCSTFSVPVLQSCVFSRSEFYGDEMFQSFYSLSAGGGATTTTTSVPSGSTTTTTLGGGGGQDPLCPSIGEVVILAGTGATSCATNGDCPSGQLCDAGLSLCTSLSELDTGWTGIAHDADVNDELKQRARLLCPGPFNGASSEPCGECDVLGLLADTRDCRCAGDNRTVCDEPFVADADDCGGGICNCYLGAPLPLSAGNTPACSVNRFSSDVSGTANVDLGEGAVTANLAAVAYLGINLTLPCPACGGTCVGPFTCHVVGSVSGAMVADSCAVNADCDAVTGGGGECTPGSACTKVGTVKSIGSVCGVDADCDNAEPGIGVCTASQCSTVGAAIAQYDACSVNADCNNEGSTGICSSGPICSAIGAFATSGDLCSVDAECDNNDPGVGSCIAGDPCAVDSDCDSATASGDGVCGNYDDTPKDGVRNGTCIGGANHGQSCDIDAYNSSFPAPGLSGAGMALDCFPDPGKNVSGTGLKISLTQTTGTSALPAASVTCGFPPFVTYDCPCGQCSNDSSIPCSTDAQCSGGGTCVSDGNGAPLPDQCSTTTDCVDIGGGEGECNVGPNDRLCDGIVRADGAGFIACLSNADCSPDVIGLAAGDCTITKRRECFVDPITATGTPDPQNPVAVASFCIGKTSNGGINTVAGLPGPARVKNQADAKTFCDSDPNTQYQPGVGGCP